MPGIVIVSHSQQLAQGVVELANQMTQKRVSIALAGGIDDPENPIGTDAMAILAAIESVYSEDGVVVLMDLGSAILSAEMALEFLPLEQQAHVHLCAAPLVEGAVAAAVQAAAGSSAEVIMQEAMAALAPKLSQLGVVQASELSPQLEKQPTDAPSAKMTLIIQNKMGLHARPAARFVSAAGQFQANITVQKGERTANAKSMNQVATLGVRQGDEIQITAVGEDADSALTAIRELAAANFGEEEAEPEVTAKAAQEIDNEQLPTGVLPGIAASPGIAIGPVFFYQPRLPEVRKNEVEDAAGEWGRLQTAVHQAQQDLQALIRQTTQQASATEAAIFAAHQLMLQDPDLLQTAQRRLMQEKVNAEYVWQQLIEETAVRYRSLEDEYQRARANDVLDAGNQVLRHLVAAELPALEMAEPVILVASDLTPSDTARLDPDVILGIVTELGGATAHSAILARALGIPAVVGVGTAVHQLTNGQTIALDGEKGFVFHQLDEDEIAGLEEQRTNWLAARSKAQKSAQDTAVTQDGHPIEIVANIGGLHDATVALQNGAEGVGLFRTEFLFMGRDAAPTEEEQLAVYEQIAATLGKRPLIIRTLDIGGDKPLSYLNTAQEANPFLGLRGIRFCLANRAIFRPQLRAILRASYETHIKLMFPMIGTLSELRAAKAELDTARNELRAAHIAFNENMEVGMMIEVPAAVAIADQLAQEVDFFSIGTNDLTQYVMAADRGNAQVAELVDALQPAVLRLIQQTATAAHQAGIWVGICGELAGRPEVAPLLVGLGIDELSMNAPAIPAVKEAVRRCKKGEVEGLVTAVLNCDSAKSVAEYLGM